MKTVTLSVKLLIDWKRQIAMAKAKHKKSKSCSFPGTCGACHFYSGNEEMILRIINYNTQT